MSQAQHCWHLGLCNSLLWVVLCSVGRSMSSVPDYWFLLDAIAILPSSAPWQSKMTGLRGGRECSHAEQGPSYVPGISQLAIKLSEVKEALVLVLGQHPSWERPQIAGKHEDLTAALHPSYRSRSKCLRRTPEEPGRLPPSSSSGGQGHQPQNQKKWRLHAESLKREILSQISWSRKSQTLNW